MKVKINEQYNYYAKYLRSLLTIVATPDASTPSSSEQCGAATYVSGQYIINCLQCTVVYNTNESECTSNIGGHKAQVISLSSSPATKQLPSISAQHVQKSRLALLHHHQDGRSNLHSCLHQSVPSSYYMLPNKLTNQSQ